MLSITKVINADACKITVIMYEAILLQLFNQVWVLNIVRYGVVKGIVVVVWSPGIEGSIFLANCAHLGLVFLVNAFFQVLSILHGLLALLLSLPILKFLRKLSFFFIKLPLSVFL